MLQKILEPISVGVSFDHTKSRVTPRWVVWNGKLHAIVNMGLHHTYRAGRTLYHVFSVASKTLFFKLILDTDTLKWKLDEVSDGLAD